MPEASIANSDWRLSICSSLKSIMAKAKTLKKAQGDGDGEIGEYGTSNDSANVRLALDRSKVKWLAEDCYVFATSVPKMGESNLSVTLPQLNISQHKESLEVYTNRVRNPELTVTTLNLNNDNVYPFSYSGKPLTAIDNIHIDICLNAGGPVWTTAFRPKRGIVEVVDDRGIVAMDEYLAVGVSQLGISNVVEACAEQQHMLGELNNTDSLLQIWRLHGNYSQIRIVDKSKIPAPVKKSDDPNYVPKPKGRPRKYPRPDEPPKDATVVEQKAAEEPVAPAEPEQLEIPRYSDVRAELAYCVALEGRGAAWSAKWGPALAHDEQTLGLLAVETGDGSCLILQLPKQVGGSAGSAGSEEGVPSTPDMEGISVLSEEGVVRWEVVVLGLMVQCVAWNTHKTGQFSCGMSDGSVTVWDLNMHQPVAGAQKLFVV